MLDACGCDRISYSESGRSGMSVVSEATFPIVASDTDSDSAVLPAEKQQVRKLPPFRVILHNDDVNTFEHVILTILKLTPLKEPDAIERTIEAHRAGCSVLLVTTRERAELYVEQFATFSLTVTCEPDA